MNETEKQIVEILEKLRPYLQRDGGDVEYVKFEDGIVYEESTVKYIRAMGRINEKLAEQADRVVEVVVGIPVIVKEG